MDGILSGTCSVAARLQRPAVASYETRERSMANLPKDSLFMLTLAWTLALVVSLMQEDGHAEGTTTD